MSTINKIWVIFYESVTVVQDTYLILLTLHKCIFQQFNILGHAEDEYIITVTQPTYYHIKQNIKLSLNLFTQPTISKPKSNV